MFTFFSIIRAAAPGYRIFCLKLCFRFLSFVTYFTEGESDIFPWIRLKCDLLLLVSFNIQYALP